MSQKTLVERLTGCLEYHAVDGKLEIAKVVEIVQSQLDSAFKRGYGKGVNETEQRMLQSRKNRAIELGLTKAKKQPKYLRQEVNKLGYKSISVQQMLREE